MLSLLSLALDDVQLFIDLAKFDIYLGRGLLLTTSSCIGLGSWSCGHRGLLLNVWLILGEHEYLGLLRFEQRQLIACCHSGAKLTGLKQLALHGHLLKLLLHLLLLLLLLKLLKLLLLLL